MKLRYLLPALLLAALPLTPAHAFVDVSINIAPPVLPVYEQPPCPVEGYLWTPGYWGYGEEGYYWIPGVWVAPPRVGFLWTPGYWGFNNGLYVFNAGYWGPTVGFYGGVNYGFGYGGYGYGGGHWEGDRFAYNTAITRVNVTNIHNTYVDKTVIRNGGSRASFNGPGGVNARPRPDELAAEHGPHVQPTSEQMAHQQTASQNRQLLASVNHGHPAMAAMRSTDAHREGAEPHAAAAPAERQPFAAQHADRSGLSPEERQVVDRRQAAMDQRRADAGPGYDRGAQRERGNDERAASYGGNDRSHGDPRAQQTEKAERQQQKAERQQQKVERRGEGGGKREDKKHDKHDDGR